MWGDCPVARLRRPPSGGPCGRYLVLIGVVNLPIIHYSVEWWKPCTRDQRGCSKVSIRRCVRPALVDFWLPAAVCHADADADRNLILLMEKRRPWVSELILKEAVNDPCICFLE